MILGFFQFYQALSLYQLQNELRNILYIELLCQQEIELRNILKWFKTICLCANPDKLNILLSVKI